MPCQTRNKREIPPTAGLPLQFSDFLTSPPASLAQGVHSLLGIPEPIYTCSGTAAFIIAVHTLQQRSPTRRTVIIPAYTCPLIPLARHFLPDTDFVLCDLSPNGIDLDPEHLTALCDTTTLAVVVTHLGGRVADTATAVDIAHGCGAFVIEDAAQALGALQNGNSVGLAGDVGFFSLAVGKGLTMYEGGLLFSRSPQLQSALQTSAQRMLPSSMVWNSRRILELLGYGFFYRPDRLWHVYGKQLHAHLDRGDEAAAVGDVFSQADIPLHRPDAFRVRVAANALLRLPDFLEQGRVRARQRIAALQAIGAFVVDDRPGDNGTWPFFMVLMPTAEQRDAVLAQLWRKGVGVSKLFVHAVPDYSFLGGTLSGKREYPCARAFASRMFTITNSHWLDDTFFDQIVTQLRGFY